MKVLIIEDEELAQDELERIILKRFPKFSIVAKLETVSESIAWLSANTADLIFLDIHLADGNGFDIFREIDVKTPIIFTTAYDRYAIDAFKLNGIGYLLKPIVESELVSAVNKLDYSDVRLKSLLAEIRPAVEYKSRIIVKTSNRVGFIRIEDIAYFYSEDRLTFAVERDGKKHVVEYTYGLGLGFGTQIGWKNGWGNQIEILGYSITEGGNFQRGVNMLSQLKINVSKKLRKRLKVFAGPVLNMTVSDYVNPYTGITGCSICPYSLFDHKTDDIAIKGWIEFNAGVSF